MVINSDGIFQLLWQVCAGGHLQPQYPTDVSGTVFEKFETETWVSNTGITATFNLDAGYETGLSNTVAVGDKNGLSEREEQFADIIEGVIVDELAGVKFDNESMRITA